MSYLWFLNGDLSWFDMSLINFRLSNSESVVSPVVEIVSLPALSIWCRRIRHIWTYNFLLSRCSRKLKDFVSPSFMWYYHLSLGFFIVRVSWWHCYKVFALSWGNIVFWFFKFFMILRNCWMFYWFKGYGLRSSKFKFSPWAKVV